MRTLIVYDSLHGNTAQVAQAIGDALAGEVVVRRAGEAAGAEVKAFDLLIVGSPTHGGRPTEAMQGWLDRIPPAVLQGILVAAFDTRFSTRLVRVFGYAAPRIADSLEKKGATLLVPPTAFFVKGREGPLKEGELERAARWAQEIIASKLSEKSEQQGARALPSLDQPPG
ncbi:MAG: flavodoxin family protein [Chloroflexi bacterium]|nr:flavodoxin family protein [Chloroflexota bacterium]MBU1749759.1 flavodoxin family protein [Chloroflexota bacterium]MBU1879277.1 flavodoxin family protein [Chloroflexota bacterium]